MNFSNIIEFAFPFECALCRSKDGGGSRRGAAYCAKCSEGLCPVPMNRCQKCDAEIGPFSVSDDGCHHCRDRDLRFRSVTCLGMYEGDLSRAILEAKWSYSAVRIVALSRMLAEHRLLKLKELKIDRIVPIPQHWTQRWWRSFNQARLIAEELAAVLSVPCDALMLVRSRRTRPQKRVRGQQRFANQEGSFELRSSRGLEDQRVLLVDDVVTSGATCSEAARVLKRAGASIVHVAALARVLEH